MKKDKLLTNLFVMIVYAAVGLAIAIFADNKYNYINSTGDYIDAMLVVLAYAIISFLIHIFIHELGHLIFGILTGYKFNSFRVGSYLLQKTNGKYEIKNLHIMGTGGQCLMEAPEMDDEGEYPYKLYHLGGIINNLIASILGLIICLLLFIICTQSEKTLLIKKADKEIIKNVIRNILLFSFLLFPCFIDTTYCV